MSLHSITLNGESVLLFLAPVDWAEGVAITHRLDAEVEEGLTGLESRRPRYGALRLEMTFTALVTGSDVGTLREGLRSAASLRVAVPFWPDLLEAGTAVVGIYTAPNVVQWNMDTGAFAVNKVAALHPLRAPLVVGRLSDESEMEVLGGGLVSVTMKVVEDSPYSERIGLNSVDVGDDWPTDLMPDWKKNTAGIQHRAEAQQVGEGRERHVEGIESLVRMTQQANFVLPDAARIRRLLSFYRARRGRAESFVMPFCLQDGTTAIHHGRFRFAKDGLKLTYSAPGVAEAAVSFVEAPDFVGETQARAATAYLFEFVYEVPSPVIYRYTNYEKPLVYAGHTYEPQKIEHGSLKQSTNPAKDELTVTCGEFTDSLGRRNPLWQRVGHGLERRLLLTVYACNPAAPNDSASVYWRGSCGEVTPTGRLWKAKCVPYAGRLDSMAPATILKSGCNNFFCDRLCDPVGTIRAALTTTGAVSGASGTVLKIAALNHPDGYFAGGWVEVGEGDAHEFRAIQTSRRTTTGIELILQRPLLRSHTGETATFLPDCDGQPSRCKAYGNYARFRGFPFIPADNPTLPDSSVDMDYAKK